MKTFLLTLFILMAPAFCIGDQAMNQEFRAGYRNVQEKVLASLGPIIIAKGDDLILYFQGEREEVRYLPELYHQLKEVDHVPVALEVFLYNLEMSKESLDLFRKKIVRFREELDFPDHLMKRQRSILDRCLGLIDEINRGNTNALSPFCQEIAQDLLLNAEQAAFLQLDALHEQIQQWKKRVPTEDWNQMAVIVIGPQMPRVGEVTLQYFSRLTGNPLANTQVLPANISSEKNDVNLSKKHRRLIYAENLWDEKMALNLLATHIIDEQIGHIFFDDRQRMFYDLLSEAAYRRLHEKCDCKNGIIPEK